MTNPAGQDGFTSELLGMIQTGLPAAPSPFAELAERLGSTEEEVLSTLASLCDEGIIRTIGPVFAPRLIGYTGTLVAARVKRYRLAELAAEMLEIPEITHNYLRDHDFNLWFTITARSTETIEDIVAGIGKFPGVKQIMNLPVVREYKINAVFGGTGPSPSLSPRETETINRMDDCERALVRALQDEFSLKKRPFLDVAEAADATEDAVIDTVKRWLESGVIRRFGARINHRRIGYTANVLVAWHGSAIDRWGEQFAAIPAVSHCYRRKAYPEWPFELYTMVHARSEEELDGTLADMKAMAEGATPMALRTIHELKKTSMKYFREDYYGISPLTHEKNAKDSADS